MAEQKFEVKISAIGEVRDAEGNLLSSHPIEAVQIVTESELRAMTEGAGE